MGLSNRYKIQRTTEELETHEVFLDKLARVKEEQFGLSEKKFEVKIKEKIIYSIFILFFSVASILFAKVFYLQIFEGEELYAIGERNKSEISLIRPERGLIYDKNFKKLVLNISTFDLVCDKRNFYERNQDYLKELEVISETLSINLQDLEKKFYESEESKVVVVENVNHENMLILEIKIKDLPDCRLEQNTVRNYSLGAAFSHTLGYMGRINKEELNSHNYYTIADYIGKTGLEKYYENFLRGVPGELKIIRDAFGIRKGDDILSLPKEGYSLVLNIDSDFQNQVYNALEKSIKNIGSQKGAAVALDPRTGAVLALVSYPSFDNNVFSLGVSENEFNSLQSNPNQPFFNRAISGQYPTGSTIKPFIAYGALQENIISPDKLINDPGYILVQNQYDPSITYRFGGVEPHGLVDMREAIAVSSNIYFYTVGGGYGDQKGLGPTRIKKYLNLFGWEEKTGIDLPGELKGFIPSPEWKKQAKNENWWDGDTYNLSIGQSDLKVTPLQLALAYSAIANKGTLYKPQIVKEIINGSPDNPTVMQSFNTEIIKNNFLDLEDLKVVREGMRQAVTSGSASMLSSIPVLVAAKTGTAEIPKAGHYNTWVAAFAPYENPEILLVVTIEEVQGLRAATLPVAQQVLQYYFSK